jgi:hypothetical protein
VEPSIPEKRDEPVFVRAHRDPADQGSTTQQFLERREEALPEDIRDLEAEL